MPTDLDRYTYRVTWSEEDQEFVGLCAEFPSLSWLAINRQDALKGICKAVATLVKDLERSGELVPEALALREYSGRFVVRMPRELHRQLAIEAAESGVSLNRLACARLARLD